MRYWIIALLAATTTLLTFEAANSQAVDHQAPAPNGAAAAPNATAPAPNATTPPPNETTPAPSATTDRSQSPEDESRWREPRGYRPCPAAVVLANGRHACLGLPYPNQRELGSRRSWKRTALRRRAAMRTGY